MLSITFRIKEKTNLGDLKTLVTKSTDELVQEFLKYSFISPFACKAALINFDEYVPNYCESYLINEQNINPEAINRKDTKKEEASYIVTFIINNKDIIKVRCSPSWKAENFLNQDDNIITCDFAMKIISEHKNKKDLKFRVMTKEEYRKLINYFTGDDLKSIRSLAVYTLAADTKLRQKAISNLKVSDLEGLNLSTNTRDILNKYITLNKSNNEYLFTTIREKEKMNSKDFSKMFETHRWILELARSLSFPSVSFAAL